MSNDKELSRSRIERVNGFTLSEKQNKAKMSKANDMMTILLDQNGLLIETRKVNLCITN